MSIGKDLVNDFGETQIDLNDSDSTNATRGPAVEEADNPYRPPRSGAD